jgi:glycosyltransferase involved in cell wall biosynthesis
MAQLIAIDARDAAASQLRGWGRYAECLIRALPAALPAGLTLELVDGGWPGPEVAFEQLVLPVHLKRRRAALVHVCNCFLPLVRPCPGVVTIHDLAFEAWPSDFSRRTGLKYRKLTPRAARSAERVICPSAFTARDLVERYGIDPGKLRVIPEAPALALGGAPVCAGPYLLAVGDLRQKKNLGALVRAFAALSRAGAIPHRLVLAGVDSGEGAHLRALAGQAPLELTGYVDDARLDALIRGADLLVNPSLYEGFGLVVLEAMVRGTPVLAARAGALPDTGGDAAEYFEPGDPDALAAALAKLLSSPEIRAELGQRGREWGARFSWERTARETVAVYRELLE